MKIYAQTPNKFVRLQINKIGEETQYLTLTETTRQEVISFIEKLLQEAKLPVFTKGKRTRIDIREAIGGTNGKSTSVSFFGLSTIETLNLITENIK